MDHATKKATILDSVIEIDGKLLDATIESVIRRLSKLGIKSGYNSTTRILGDLVKEGKLGVTDLGGEGRTNKYFPAAKKRIMA